MADSKETLGDRRSDRDLLVRIDERVAQMMRRLKDVEEVLKEKPCSKHDEKIEHMEQDIQEIKEGKDAKLKTLERMMYGTWGSIGLYLLYNILGVKNNG